jgi:hypothetical protein
MECGHGMYAMQQAHHSSQTETPFTEFVPDDGDSRMCELKKAFELLKLVKSAITELPDGGRIVLETLAAKMQTVVALESSLDAIEISRGASIEGVSK